MRSYAFKVGVSVAIDMQTGAVDIWQTHSGAEPNGRIALDENQAPVVLAALRDVLRAYGEFQQFLETNQAWDDWPEEYADLRPEVD